MAGQGWPRKCSLRKRHSHCNLRADVMKQANLWANILHSTVTMFQIPESEKEDVEFEEFKFIITAIKGSR